MTERWIEIAHELGSYDDLGKMEWRDPDDPNYGDGSPGPFVSTEEACRRIAELEDQPTEQAEPQKHKQANVNFGSMRRDRHGVKCEYASDSGS
ncbi:MAG: hypothetical protein NWQ95_02535 [Verrucomicrobiales bacterium]|nr:hypothetical protein [Verrucomicrobiales bacterium]